jgi:XTP/dITP diphosphohydrolase
MKLIFATGNNGKLEEVKEIFKDSNIEVVSPAEYGEMPEIIEDGDTFESNAKKKAEQIFALYNLPTIADDSGLEVKQLNNAPGIYSARYGGENCTYADNNKKLIEELKLFPKPHPAQFVCWAVFYDGKNYYASEGTLPGRVIDKPRGKRGFGYDPIFIPNGYEQTLAELGLNEKNLISHRGNAFNSLKKILVNKGLL